MSVLFKKCQRKCCVAECKAKTTENTIFHKFPNDSNRKADWIRACNITTKVTCDMLVCGSHFTNDDYQSDANSGLRYLKVSAVPKLNLLQNVDKYIMIASNKQINSNQAKRKCSIPHCNVGPNEKRSYHLIPGDEKIKQQWVRACGARIISHPYSCVCSAHFEKSDFVTGPSSRKQVLKNNAVPSLYLPKHPSVNISEVDEKVTTIIYVPENCGKKIVSNRQDNLNLDNKNVFSQVQNIGTIQRTSSIKMEVKTESDSASEVTIIKETIASSKQKNPELQGNKNNTLHFQRKVITGQQNNNNIVSNQTYSIKKNNGDNSSNKKTIIRSGISAVTLCADCGQYCKIEDRDLLYKSYKNCETLAAELLLELQELTLSNEDERILLTKKGIEICNRAIKKENINLMELLTSDGELMAFTGINFELLDKLTKLVSNVETISLMRYKTPPKTRIVVCLCKLRINLSFASLGMLFGLTQQLCANNFFSMLKTLSVILAKTIHWPKTEELLKDLPECFQSFKQTRVILNCSEVQFEKQRCFNCQQKLMESNVVQHQTIKLVLGVAPSGLIIFKSHIYEHQSADVSIFTQTNIMEKLDPLREAIMADKTLNIEVECAERNITLIKLPKLVKNKQFGKNDVELIKNISTARIHVDRTLHRFKMYKIIQAKVHWRILPYLDEVCTVIAGIVNMKNPIPPNEIDIKSVGPIRK